MANLEKVYCFANVLPDGGNYKSEYSLDGQRFRSPIFAPMHGCQPGQQLEPGQCREPQLQACSAKQDPWLWTAGQQGCRNSSLCSALSNPRAQFICKDRHCQTVIPTSQAACQAVPFRRTFAGNMVKANFNIDNLASLPYRFPLDSSIVPPPTVSNWTSVPNVKLLRSNEIGFDLTMYNR